MARYLYGASVQGIQGFIFQTNKLKEVVGASEIVEQICSEDFFTVADVTKGDQNLILAAAGNIKFIFEEKDKSKLENLVRIFPKYVMQKAPGITISQAIVPILGSNASDAISELEVKLKIQRNIVSMPLETGFMCLERSRRTGGVGINYKDNEVIDEATSAKINNNESIKLFQKISALEEVKAKDLAYDIEEITASGNNKWIAVVHADGNGLGNILQNIGAKLSDENKFNTFSKVIEDSTLAALQSAFFAIIKKEEKFRFPIRPILVGGDDVTFIIRADLALDFTSKFLAEFEKITQDKFKQFDSVELKTHLAEGLTACAGIAYVKESYPLHYALDLAEQLTKDAKKMVKADGMPKKGNLPMSSLAFFKVQDSFVESLKEMKERSKKSSLGINYDYGPYLINENVTFANLVDLKSKLDLLDNNKTDNSKGISKLRQLITESFKDLGTLEFMKSRMSSINKKFYDELKLANDLKTDGSKSVLLDLIQLHSFKTK